MRFYWAPLATVGLTLAAHSLSGQMPPPLQTPIPTPKLGTIAISQAEVYSAPGGAAAFPTGRLRYGESVWVLGESQTAPGWLVIVPPPGSFSWIEARFVKPVVGFDRIGVVDTGDPKTLAPIMPGSLNKEPSGVIAKVATGTQLFLLDRPTSSSSGVSWYPIVPVANEVRFVPLDAVRNGGANGYNTAAYGGATPVGWQTPAGPAAKSSTPYWELNKQAEQALAAGVPERAVFLYSEAIAQTNDPAWRSYLMAQLAKVAPGYAPNSGPFQTTSSSAASRPTGTTSWVPTAPVSNSPVPNSPGPQPSAPLNTRSQSPDGILSSTGTTWGDGQPLYVLEEYPTRKPLMYVVAQKGSSLQTIAGQFVAIYGTFVTRNDAYINAQVLVADGYQVKSLPSR